MFPLAFWSASNFSLSAVHIIIDLARSEGAKAQKKPSHMASKASSGSTSAAISIVASELSTFRFTSGWNRRSSAPLSREWVSLAQASLLCARKTRPGTWHRPLPCLSAPLCQGRYAKLRPCRALDASLSLGHALALRSSSPRPAPSLAQRCACLLLRLCLPRARHCLSRPQNSNPNGG